MRIIAGSLKGKKIPAPDSEGVRPTSDRTKEAIFSILESRLFLDGLSILDLFAGTGNLGFEAISRGAGKVLFVDATYAVIQQISKSAALLGVEKQCRVQVADGAEFIESTPQTFDLIFADPPYEYTRMGELPDLVLSKAILSEEGYFVLEHDRRISFTDHEKLLLSRPYGRTLVSVFSH